MALAILCSGWLGYSVASPLPAVPLAVKPHTSASKTHSPKGNVAVSLSSSLAVVGSDTELHVKVEIENRGETEAATVLAATLYDDVGGELIPETIQVGAKLAAKGVAKDSVEVPGGLPDGFFRLEIVGAARQNGAKLPETVTTNVFFSNAGGKLSVLSHDEWLRSSNALLAGNTQEQAP